MEDQTKSDAVPKDMSWTQKHSNTHKPQFRSALITVVSDIIQLNFTTNKSHIHNLKKYCPFWSLCHLIISNSLDKEDCKKSNDDILEIIMRFHRGREAFLLGGQEMKITKQDIQKTFDISGGENKITVSGWERMERKHKSGLYERRFKGLGKINQTNLKGVLKAVTKGTSKGDTEDVPRIMTLYLLASLLVPTCAHQLNWGYLKYVEDLEIIKNFDWSGHIFEKLYTSLCTNNVPGRVSGCTIALPYLVMEKFNITKPANPNAVLLCHKWNLKEMTKLTRNAKFTVNKLCQTKNLKGWPTSKKRSAQEINRNVSSPSLKCDPRRAVSQDPEKIESCKKMRKVVAERFDSFVALSPKATESSKQVHLAEESNSVLTDKTPTIPNSNGGLRENDSGNQHMLGNPNAGVENFPIEIFELDNSLLMSHSHPPPSIVNATGNDVDVKPSQVVSDFKSFIININGIDITKDILERARVSYYNLCRSRGSLLHSDLTVGINLKYVIFMITETANISTAIKNCKLSTPQDDLFYWTRALESFSAMGMDVGFMRARVKGLLDFTTKETKAAEDAKAKGKGFEEKIRDLEIECEKMREKKRRFDYEREGVQKNAKKTFKVEATAPW